MENSKDPDYKTAAIIQEKLGDTSGVSYSEIASRAIERGKTNLAIMVSRPTVPVPDIYHVS